MNQPNADRLIDNIFARDNARASSAEPVRLIDTTMLYAPRSGGVRRYLNSKRAWLAAQRPDVRHTLVVPGARDAYDGRGRVSIYAAPLPFGDGYRWPVVKQAWMERLIRQRPDIIEAGDPYTPGLAALRAGDALGVPVVGFCHTDLGALAGLAGGTREARRLIEGGGVSIDGERITDPAALIEVRTGAVLRVGRRRFTRLVRGVGT
ncbi:MAG: glycosyltransferase [Dehalococcoidia bacterium]|nr:glycosyltransferase [Dehalococcoidia bacterium]